MTVLKASNIGPLTFNLVDVEVTADYLIKLSEQNPGWRIERTAENDLLIRTPIDAESGNKKFELLGRLGVWNESQNLGYGFDSSTGFTLPNGAIYSSDLAWISKERWEALPKEQQKTMAPIAPDFVLELRSGEHSLTQLKSKMEEYIANGVQLAWLIDPKSEHTLVYDADGEVHTVPFDMPLPGGAVLPGFDLNLRDIFKPGG